MSVKDMNALLPEKEQEKKLTLAQSFVANVNEDLNDIKHSFLKIGYELNEANKNGYYKELGYASLVDLAEDIWGFSKSSTYNLIDVYELAHDPSNPMQIAPQYDKFSQSHLVAMTRLKYPGAMVTGIIQNSKCSVRELEKFVTLWNKKCDMGSGFREGCVTVKEYLDKYESEDSNGNDKATVLAPKQEEAFQTSGKSDEEHSLLELREITPIIECEILEVSPEQNKEIAADIKPEKRPESEIIKVGLTGVDIYVEDAKFRIYDRYRNAPLKGNFSEFIKGIYNYANKQNFTHGFYSKEDNMNRTYDNNGIQFISFDPFQKINLTWEEAARHISDLIYTDEYLTEAEQEQYLNWKTENEGLVVNVEYGKAKIAKTKLLNLKNDIARKAWLDAFRQWGVWVDVPEVSKTFYRFNFANGCAVIVEVGIEYGDGYTIKKGEREILKYSILDSEHPKFDTHGISYTAVIQWLSQHGKEV